MGALLQDLQTAKTTDAYNDVCLAGLDGSEIPASRFILSMRSPVFHKMFFGHFKEAASLAVPLDFSSSVIQLVVNYCYSDDAGTKGIEDETCNEEDVRQMVRLRSAADFFELPKLRESTTKLLLSMALVKPAMTCAILDELSILGEWEGSFGEACLGIIGIKTEAALLPEDDRSGRGILACSPSVIGNVLSDKVLSRRHHTLMARCLQRWERNMLMTDASSKNKSSGDKMKDPETMIHDNDDDEEPITNPTSETVRSVGTRIAGGLHLHLIAPSKLVELMSSEFFTKEQLYDALKDHALAAEEKGATAPPTAGDPLKDGIFNNTGCCIVQGAGTLEVNGVYVKESSLGDGVHTYSMKGTYKNKPVSFNLLRCVFMGGKRWWWLQAIPEDASENVCLYWALLDKADATKIPRNNWKKRDGEGSPPVVLVPG
jgi:hypothetical protein